MWITLDNIHVGMYVKREISAPSRLACIYPNHNLSGSLIKVIPVTN